MIERTLVVIKPDGVQRGFAGKIITRFEEAGLKIAGMKMVWADREFSRKHYAELVQRKGKHIRDLIADFLVTGPVIAMVLEGVQCVEVVRKMVGVTEPSQALPGTIRGDYCHVSYAHADKHKKAVKNLIHASASRSDADFEIRLWFSEKELHSYKSSHEEHVF